MTTYDDRMIELGGECDFAGDIARQYPLYVSLAILGLPESDYPRMLRLTQELFGAEDDDFKRDDDVLAGIIQTVADFVNYFDGITAAIAGHDTTSNSMSGGMQALIENPDQLARLRADSSLLNSTVDEMIRWTTPVKHAHPQHVRERPQAAADSLQNRLRGVWSFRNPR